MKHYLLALALLFNFACGHAKPVIHPTTVTIVERALNSVGHIKGMSEGHEYGCSAIAIAERKWLTAAHCMGEKMMLDGHPAFMIAQDVSLDLAVIVSDYVKPALHIRVAPLTRQEEVIGLGFGYSWKYPTITRHRVMILDYTPWPGDVAPGTWFSGGFIGGQSGGAVIDVSGLVVGVIQRGDAQVGYGVNSAKILAFLRSTVVVVVD